MGMRDDLRMGAMMLAGRTALRAQATLGGDPLAKLLARGPKADPYPMYELARSRGDLHRSKLGVYVTASHELSNTILRETGFGVQSTEGRSRQQSTGAPPELSAVNPIEQSFLSFDPPRHTRLRKLVAPSFLPRSLRDRGERIEAIVDGFLDELAGRPCFDLISDFAVRVPIQVICDLLGVPGAEYPRFIRWGASVALSLDSTWTLGQYRRLRTSLEEMTAFFRELLAERRQRPADDVVSDLVRAQDDGDEPVSEQDLLATAELLLVAGFETTVNLIGNGALRLLHDDDARHWLLANPDRSADLVEEVLRFDPPVQHTMRLTHRPTTIAGTDLPADTGIAILLAGANRDPAVFENPDKFDPERPNNREHLAFSAGVHYCLGAGLARMEAAVALRALFERYPDLRAGGPVRHRRTRNIRGVLSLPVTGAQVKVNRKPLPA